MLDQTEAVFTLNPRAIWRCVDGEAIVLDLNTGTYFGLNHVATRVWTLIEDEVSREAILATLEKEFDASGSELASDLDDLLGELLGHKLIVEYNAPS